MHLQSYAQHETIHYIKMSLEVHTHTCVMHTGSSQAVGTGQAHREPK